MPTRDRRRSDRAARDGRKLDPGANGKMMTKRKFLGIIPFGNRHQQLFRRLSQQPDAYLGDPQPPCFGQGRAADGQCRDRYRRTGLWKTMPPSSNEPHFQQLDKSLEARPMSSTRPARQGQGNPRNGPVLHPPADHGFAHADWRVTVPGYLALDLVRRTMLSWSRSRPRLDHHRRRLAHRRHRRAGDDHQRLVLEQVSAAQYHHRVDDRHPGALPKPDRGVPSKPRRRRSPRTLQRAFQNIYDTMDNRHLKLQALTNMKQTVERWGARSRNRRAISPAPRSCRRTSLNRQFAVHTDRSQMSTDKFDPYWPAPTA